MYFIALSGASASGKTTLAEKLQEHKPEVFYKPIQCTTRPMRPNEKEGVNYFFKTDEEMDELIENNKLVALSDFELAPARYGTERSQLRSDKINLVVTSMEGLSHLLLSRDPADKIKIISITDVSDEVQREGRDIVKEDGIIKKQISAYMSLIETDDIEVEFIKYSDYKKSWGDIESLIETLKLEVW